MTVLAVVNGVVEHGVKLGREIGFPTANISGVGLLSGVASGVYFCRVGQWWAIANLGVNPTVGILSERKFEVHIIDYDGPELYGERLRVEVLEFVRSERKFGSIIELREAIEGDMIEARRLIGEYTKLTNQ